MKLYNLIKIFLYLTLFFILNGCVLTKVITVPMRIGGAAISIVPGVGETIHDTIDKTADKVDDIPI